MSKQRVGDLEGDPCHNSYALERQSPWGGGVTTPAHQPVPSRTRWDCVPSLQQGPSAEQKALGSAVLL